jgi:glucose-6-phosphate 1-dehydrogenase
LAKKKIFPTLWWLYRDDLLPDQILFIGYARTNLSLDDLRKSFEKNCKVRDNEAGKFEDFVKRITYISGQYDKDEGFLRLKASMDAMEQKLKSTFLLKIH